jgi:hypothetical protein
MEKRKTRNKGKPRAGHPIAWQNKDITSKLLAENFRGRSLEAYGLQLPRVVDSQPTNLPAIEANELKIDTLFILEDGTYAIIDYESEYREKNKGKYLGYIARLSNRLYNELGRFPPIRVIVIYTADVQRGTTNPELDLGSMRVVIDEAFLSDLDSEAIRDRIAAKLDHGEELDDLDLMQLIVYPLSCRGDAAKREAVSEAISLSERLTDDVRRASILASINVFANRIISPDDQSRIRRLIGMIDLGKEIWEGGREEGREEGANMLAELLKQLTPGSSDYTLALNGSSKQRNRLYKKYHVMQES